VLGKPNSSIHVGYELVKRGEVDGLVGAGNSGAMMAAAMVIVGNLPGVDRPAIASLVPTSVDYALLIDAGANVEVKPSNLVEFAVMGSVYCRRVRKIPRPKVGLLSNGEEDSKGNELTRAAAATLREMAPHINYIGYVEGRDINRGDADVIVTDGFTGNVALKTMEGFGAFILGNLRAIFGATLRGRLAYFLVRKRLTALRERFDPSEYGGAPLLGVSGVAIIAHGSSNARAIRNAIRAAADEALVRHVNTEIVETLRKIPTPAPAKPAGKGIRALFAKVRGRLHRHSKETSEPAGKAAEPGGKAPAQAPRGDTHPVEALESPRIEADSLQAESPLSGSSNGGGAPIGIASETGNDAGGGASSPQKGTPHRNPPGHLKN
jgi:phosphate acyltransferase